MVKNYKKFRSGMWERTPWYLRLLGKPKFRRKFAYYSDLTKYYWEYED